jgi:hypothetical protein
MRGAARCRPFEWKRLMGGGGSVGSSAAAVRGAAVAVRAWCLRRGSRAGAPGRVPGPALVPQTTWARWSQDTFPSTLDAALDPHCAAAPVGAGERVGGWNRERGREDEKRHRRQRQGRERRQWANGGRKRDGRAGIRHGWPRRKKSSAEWGRQCRRLFAQGRGRSKGRRRLVV